MTRPNKVSDARTLTGELEQTYDRWLRRPDPSADEKLVKSAVYLLAQEMGYWRWFSSADGSDWRKFPDALTSRVITNSIYLTTAMVHSFGSESPELHAMGRAIVLDILLKHLMSIDPSEIEVVYKEEAS